MLSCWGSLRILATRVTIDPGETRDEGQGRSAAFKVAQKTWSHTRDIIKSTAIQNKMDIMHSLRHSKHVQHCFFKLFRESSDDFQPNFQFYIPKKRMVYCTSSTSTIPVRLLCITVSSCGTLVYFHHPQT